MNKRIAGINISQKNKPLYICLTNVKGIGVSLSKKICKDLNLNPMIRINDLCDEDFTKIINYIEKQNIIIGSALNRKVAFHISTKIKISSRVGMRHVAHLPVRGQNTKSNGSTARKLNNPARFTN